MHAEYTLHNLNVNFFYVPSENATFQVSTICIKKEPAIKKTLNRKKRELREKRKNKRQRNEFRIWLLCEMRSAVNEDCIRVKPHSDTWKMNEFAFFPLYTLSSVFMKSN